jgi:cystathionine beta-synthase
MKLMLRNLTRYNLRQPIGNTPLAELQYFKEYTTAKVFAKLECFNPGLSIKDRIVKHMIAKAEQSGQLKPRATIVEATSGNTGYSLAMFAAKKGYQCVVTVKDTISRPKVALMEAFGARVIMCPATAKPEHPDFYMNKAKRLALEIPNAFYLNQNDNPANSEAHYLTTGPEIWEQTQGKVTHLISAFSTGGTISGTARYLKEKNPDIKVIAADSAGSILKTYFETGKIAAQVTGATAMEGVGKKILARNVDFSLIDSVVTADDATSALAAHELCSKEGLMMGYSSGAALDVLKKIKNELNEKHTVVLIFADHGSKYLDKIYDNQWMKAKGFMELVDEELGMISLVI